MFLFLMALAVFYACDSKEIVKQVAQSKYDELEKKYQSLQSDYKSGSQENQNLKKENRVLKEKMTKYKNGFKSMYE